MFVEFFAWYEHRESIFIAMEFIPLSDLEVFVKMGLPIDVVKTIAAQILDGIYVMHSLDLVHRDIKPAVSYLALQCQIRLQFSKTYLW